MDASGIATDGKFFSGGFPAKTKYGTYAADAVFQLDLFGQLRRATEAARAQLLSTEYAQKTEILTLVSDVATDYFALLALDLQLQITRGTVKHSRMQSSSPDCDLSTASLRSSTCCKRNRCLIPRTHRFPIWKDRSDKWKMRSVFLWAITRTE